MLLLWKKVDSFIPIILPNLNPICHLLALGVHHILHVGRIRVKSRKLSWVELAARRIHRFDPKKCHWKGPVRTRWRRVENSSEVELF
jgi:hypothetical protein